MGHTISQRLRTAVAVLVTPILGACATGNLQRQLDETRAQLARERTERLAADSALGSDISLVRADMRVLRKDLQGFETEFGAKIAALRSGIQFAFPANFAFNDATVRDPDKAGLNRFADIAKHYYGGSTITIEGFADPAGSEEYNLGLSKRRANAVRDYLGAHGLDLSMVKVVGYGKTRLINPGASHDELGAEQNRRVVFVIETKGYQAGQAVASDGPTGKIEGSN